VELNLRWIVSKALGEAISRSGRFKRRRAGIQLRLNKQKLGLESYVKKTVAEFTL
jgi:hypothetical protein